MLMSIISPYKKNLRFFYNLLTWLFTILITAVLTMSAFSGDAQKASYEYHSFNTPAYSMNMSQSLSGETNSSVKTVTGNSNVRPLTTQYAEKKVNYKPHMPVNRTQAQPYYYSLLTGEERSIYNLMLDGMNNLSGQIPIGNDLTNIQIDNAFNALIRDQSQVFWVQLGYTVHTITRTVDEVRTTSFNFAPNYSMSYDQVARAKAELENEVNKALSKLNANMSQLEMELTIHDYIIKKVNYSSEEASNSSAYPMIFTSYGALVNGRAVCEGYSKAFQLIMNKVGIETTVVTGNIGGGGHMWNMAKISGKWYHVDLTFDDPGIGSAVRRNYFNLTTPQITKNRSINYWLGIPSANSTELNYFRVNGLSFSSYNTSAYNRFVSEAVRAVNSNETVAQIRITDNFNSALNTLLNSNKSTSFVAIWSAAERATNRNITRFQYSADHANRVITIYLTY